VCPVYHDPAWFELAERSITTVRLPVQEVALTAASLVMETAAAGPTAPGSSSMVRLAPSLVLRGSTAPLLIRTAQG